MGKDTRQLDLPDLYSVRAALAGLSTADAVSQLETALEALQTFAASAMIQTDRLEPAIKRILRLELNRFRNDLQSAGTLAEQGMTLCRNWEDQRQPAPAYDGNGTLRGTASRPNGISLEA